VTSLSDDPVVCCDAAKMATSAEVPVEIKQSRVYPTENSVSFIERVISVK
jgi:hypothetical protein